MTEQEQVKKLIENTAKMLHKDYTLVINWEDELQDIKDDLIKLAKQILSQPGLLLALPLEKHTPFNELYHAIPLAEFIGGLK